MSEEDESGIELPSKGTSNESKGTFLQFQVWGFDIPDALGISRRYTEIANGNGFRKVRKCALCFVASMDYYKANGRKVCPNEIAAKIGLNENDICKGLRLYNESPNSTFSRLDWTAEEYTFYNLERLERKTTETVVILFRLFEFLNTLRVDSYYKRSKPVCVSLGILYFHFSEAKDADPLDIEELSAQYKCSVSTIQKIATDIIYLLETHA